MRARTDFIVLHCTATPEGQYQDVKSITAMHKARGFATIGYHYLIGLKGETWHGREPDNSVGAGVAGHNYNTLHVSYVGGVEHDGKTPKDTRTPEQKRSMIELLDHLQTGKYPNALILGHRDLSPDTNHDGINQPSEWVKDCPCFDARVWARSVGLKAAAGAEKIIVKADAVVWPQEAFDDTFIV